MRIAYHVKISQTVEGRDASWDDYVFSLEQTIPIIKRFIGWDTEEDRRVREITIETIHIREENE